ncbi:FAD-dependent oxidoreductase [Pseudohalocynthiibacter aestuariivivens]|uniref:FAD-dependent oxidoreductase n=1 Tax=Roseovarius pelagicus TaxID=2980108 RepID=A0ABY6DAE2_9RHOB|nr:MULTISPECIES: FAD-dependent oxidoreductase [Rhodobacterales]QIE46022.1 FAD-dependent oxidoreductase [Pseudohalocynthiibacter aestuariivivens]UXX82018.1 FAD-dependent oxidoreductase [Roseovarius pelagicus]
MTPRNIIVIGAGICGLSSAIWLRRAGHTVTLIDRDYPGAGASYGNAGLLAEWAIVPMNTPGITRDGAKYLMSRDGPLFLQWSYLPRLIPWLAKFVANSTDARTRATSASLVHLLHDSVDQHRALTKGTRAEKWISSSDFGYVYRDRAAFDADAYGWALKREAGYVPDLIEGGAVQEAEPMLAPSQRCLAMLRGHGHILNPGAYMADLAQVFQDEGGTYLQAEMRDVTLSDGHVTEIITDHGTLACDAAVLSAGIWSKPLMAKLGVKTPLEAERGYHLHFTGPNAKVHTPLMIQSGKFAVNPMEHGLRCAGMVELGGITAPPSRAPFDLLRRNVTKMFPGLTYDSVEEWMGFRPSTPDSLPLIGEIGGSGVFAAFGHQHVGLTGGPKTGRWVADLINGRRMNADLSAFDTNRFG